MPAKLRVTPLAGEPFDLTIGNTATIGRTSDNIVCLSGSPLVSRQHALVRCHDGYQYQIIDLGSRNGTYVNDQRVVMPTTLSDGARILIAKNELVFEQVEDDYASAALEVTLAGSMAGAHSAVQPVALLVCDIRGFSTMAEKISSSELAQHLGVWFREAGNLVTKNGGTHYGSVTCGNVGVDAQRDATDRLVAAATPVSEHRVADKLVDKELNQSVVLSADFREHLPASRNLLDLGERKLKGKQQAVGVYGLA